MSSERYERGTRVREEVLGQEYSPTEGADAKLIAAYDAMSTEVAWADVWSRPELPLKTRSLLAIAFLAALDRREQLRVHVKGAIRTGNSKVEIAEVLMQSAIYCGFPVASNCFKLAQEVFDEMGI